MTDRADSLPRLPEWVGALAGAGALAIGGLVVVNAAAGLVVAAGAFAVSAGLVFGRRLPAWFLGAVWGILLLYAVLGKGGGNINVGGIYAGEMVLALGLMAAAFGGVAGAVPQRSALVWGILAFGAWGALRTLPFVGVYGINALRDAVVWGYALFALLVAGALARTAGTQRVVERYGAHLLWIPFAIPVVWAVVTYRRGWLPMVPGTDVPLAVFKSGDAAFHLVGVAAFVLLGLHQPAARRGRPGAGGGWLWWSAWLVAFALTAAASRAAVLAMLAGGAVVLLARPSTRLFRPALITVALTLAFVAFDPRIEVRDGRYLSPSELLANVTSITREEGPGNRDATRDWRLQWWRTIIDYTIHGPHFWTGKGYGINLAVDDGFLVGNRDRRPLRSPHNGHLTILARSGVPGAVLWLLLQGGFAMLVLRAWRRALARGDTWWARVDLWILACWTTFVVNATFEVSLEGPHGGIWFWSLFGFGIAALEAQRRGVRGIGGAQAAHARSIV